MCGRTRPPEQVGQITKATDVVKENADRFDERIRRVMWGLIVGGVHFPGDTEAGRLLAKDLIDRRRESRGMDGRCCRGRATRGARGFRRPGCSNARWVSLFDSRTDPLCDSKLLEASRLNLGRQRGLAS